MMGFGLLFVLLIFGGLILLGLWFAGWRYPRAGVGMGCGYHGAMDHGMMNQAQADPRAILDQRYARGEITREQYEQMKQDIAG